MLATMTGAPDLSQRASSLGPSATLALAAAAKEMAAAGRDVVNMAVGEPDFDAPGSAREAAHAAMDSGQVKYTPAAGLASLRAAAAPGAPRGAGTARSPSRSWSATAPSTRCPTLSWRS